LATMHPSNHSCGGEKRWYCVISGWLHGYASVIAQNHKHAALQNFN
jgi:hypothetical protein